MFKTTKIVFLFLCLTLVRSRPTENNKELETQRIKGEISQQGQKENYFKTIIKNIPDERTIREAVKVIKFW